MRQLEHKNASKVADDLERRYLNGHRLYRPYDPSKHYLEGPYCRMNKPRPLSERLHHIIFNIQVKLGLKDEGDWL